MSLDLFLSTAFSSEAFSSIVVFFTAMAIIAAVEIAIPLRARTHWNRVHLVPNFALTAIYVTMNLFFAAAIVLMLLWAETIGFGLLNALKLDPALEVAAAVLVLDFQTYAVHVAMHERAGLWRFHRIHHADPAVDVTTALRQHPGESLIRYVSLAVFSVAVGASPVAFAVYRLLSGIQALSEHANMRWPQGLDTALSYAIATPAYHKVHHSREREETDSNYANIFTFWDRLFFTATPAHRGLDVEYGLDGLDDRQTQSTWGLLTLPFRDGKTASPVADQQA